MVMQESKTTLRDTTVCHAERMAHELHVKLEQLAHGERDPFGFTFTTGDVGGETTQLLYDLAHLALFEKIGASCSIDDSDRILTNFGNVVLQKEAIIPTGTKETTGVQYNALRIDIL